MEHNKKEYIFQAKPNKSDLGWELDELEVAGRLAIEDQNSQDLVAHVHSKLHIKEGQKEDSDDFTSSEDSEDTESSSGDYTCSSDHVSDDGLPTAPINIT
jgi:hypothetical protein